jgi:hypothetical protein
MQRLRPFIASLRAAFGLTPTQAKAAIAFEFEFAA